MVYVTNIDATNDMHAIDFEDISARVNWEIMENIVYKKKK